MSHIFRIDDNHFATISDDHTMAKIDPELKEGELEPGMQNFLKEQIGEVPATPYMEFRTTREMLLRALKEFAGTKDEIWVGVSPKNDKVAALLRIRTRTGRIVVVAGRTDGL
jgi:hypothetical protein